MMSANSVLREVRKEHAERLHKERLTMFRDELRTLKVEVEDVEGLDFGPIRLQQRRKAETNAETNESKPEAEAEAEAETNAGLESNGESLPETSNTETEQVPEAEQLVAAAQKPKIDQEAAPPEQQERTALKTAFDKADADATGAINFQQLTQFIEDLGWNLTAQSAFDFLEKGENDAVTFEDFLRWKGFAWQHNVALVRRLSSRNLQISLDQIAEDEHEEEHNFPDSVHEAEATQDSADEHVAQLQSRVETLRNHLARLHEHYEDLSEVTTC